MLQLFSQSIPERIFAGRLLCGGRWQRIEIDSADALQIPMQGGTAFGVGSRVRLLEDSGGRQFWVMVDAGHLLPRGGSTELDRVRPWLPKCAVVITIAVLAKNQPIPETGIFSVAAPDYSKDPQRDDARAFRRRCRFDVLTVITSCVNKNPPEAFCNYSTLEAAETHTRIYGRDDFMDAIQFWQEKGYVSLLDRAGDIQIKQTLDDNMMRELSKYSWDEATPALETARTQPGAATTPTEYDVFVSHASEDKDAVVVPLTNELIQRGLRVWVDYRELRLGDKLRERIDEGLRRSRFGLVIVSPRFFGKRWPQTELDGLVALEMSDGRKRILPIWHDVEYDEVAQQSPTLATRLATKWCEGISEVADEIMRAVRD